MSGSYLHSRWKLNFCLGLHGNGCGNHGDLHNWPNTDFNPSLTSEMHVFCKKKTKAAPIKTVVQAKVIRFMNQSFTLYKHVTHSLVLVLKLETGLIPPKMGIYNPTTNREIFVGDQSTFKIFCTNVTGPNYSITFSKHSLTIYCS